MTRCAHTVGTRSKGKRWQALPDRYAATAQALDVNVVARMQPTRPTRAKDPMSEFEHQVELMKLCQMHRNRYRGLHLINASANGGLRKRGVAGQLKAMGVKSGFPDIHLPVARGGHLSLYIELKTLIGRPTADQLWWQQELLAQGHQALICRGWAAAWGAIKDYYAQASTQVSPTAQAQ